MPRKRVRVMHVVGTGGSGGVETCLSLLAAHVDPARYEMSICVVGQDGPNSAAWRRSGIPTWTLGVQGRFGPRAVLGYGAALARVRPHILHTHLGGRLVRSLARFSGCKQVIFHCHGPADDWARSDADLTAAERSKIRRSVTIGASRFLACSEHTSQMLSSLSPELLGKITVIPYGIDLERFVPAADASTTAGARARLGLAAATHVIGFVGRLTPQKGVHHLIEATRLLLNAGYDLHTVIVGDGPLRSALEQTAASVGRDRIHFLGDQVDTPELIAAFDMLVVPSKWEAFGIVNLEAMAGGLPVVAFDVGGIPEVVLADETGLLVPPSDDQALAKTIARLLDRPDERDRMGRAGRKRVEQMFHITNFTRRIEDIYRSMGPIS